MATGEPLTVRPSKIVSGHEPDKTNELLQAIARAIEKQVKNSCLIENTVINRLLSYFYYN